MSGAGRLILVIGAQRVVTDLDEAMRRIYEITNRDPRPGRTTAILVREALGC